MKFKIILVLMLLGTTMESYADCSKNEVIKLLDNKYSKQEINRICNNPIKKNRQIGNYIIHDNGTVSDTKNRLMWKICSEGQHGNKCSGVANKYKWNDAMQRFRGKYFGGYNNWRIPTIKELSTLVYCQ